MVRHAEKHTALGNLSPKLLDILNMVKQIAAKEITLFFSGSIDVIRVFAHLVNTLALELEHWDPPLDSSRLGSAARGYGIEVLRVEYEVDGTALIQELSEWEQPSEKYRGLLLTCKSFIALHYRKLEIARQAIMEVAALQEKGDECVVENGMGCLIMLSSMRACLLEDENWSWEREEFPELPDVAPSEWLHVDE